MNAFSCYLLFCCERLQSLNMPDFMPPSFILIPKLGVRDGCEQDLASLVIKRNSAHAQSHSFLYVGKSQHCTFQLSETVILFLLLFSLPYFHLLLRQIPHCKQRRKPLNSTNFTCFLPNTHLSISTLIRQNKQERSKGSREKWMEDNAFDQDRR